MPELLSWLKSESAGLDLSWGTAVRRVVPVHPIRMTAALPKLLVVRRALWRGEFLS